MTLHDYHRERYMAGDTGADDEVESSDAPKTFVQEQADLKKELMAEIKAGEGSDDDDDEDFIKSKPGQKPPPSTAAANGIHPSRQAKVKPKAKDLDISLADKDPDLFLSNYMEARAWAADGAGGSKWEAFESDDGSGNDDADEWEAAYNLRFEDPAKSNEVLTSYSRKVVEARSVRRDEPKGRKRLRELEKERKEEEKRQRHEERARLKRLKVEEAEEKLAKIKKAAGLRKGQPLKDEEWMSLLEDAWENDKWEEEMSRRFGEQYYAELEAPDSDAEGSSKKSKKPKKPKWDDDIDIKDIIPDFEDDEAKPKISLSDIEDDEAEPAEEEAAEEDEDSNLGSDLDPASDSDAPPSKKRKTTTITKALKAARQSTKRASRLERAKLEALVESHLELQDPTALKKTSKPSTSAGGGGFRYRETSPQTFGMTPRDILLAPSDSALNDFVGLKKLATFRDRDKKQKDKKRLGKKARLREWRRDVFGREYEHTGPTFGFTAAAAAGDGEQQQVLPVRDAKAAAGKKTLGEGDGEGGKKKRKRSKGKKKVSA